MRASGSDPRIHRPRLPALLSVLALMVGALLVGAPSQGSAATAVPAADYDPGASWDQSPTPYLGWSSWSMQATRRAGVNPNGSYSWLTEENVLKQADYMAAHLKEYGYEYINIDAGWWRTWNWTPIYDEHGRPAVWEPRLPSGMASIVEYIHSLGLKVGIYMPAGLETGKEGDTIATGQDLTKTVEGAPECTLADVIYPDRRLTNGWQSAYAIDFTDDDGCGQAYIDSIVDLFESWGGVDLIKVDGVGPGSGHNDISGANSRYDNRAEIQAYDKAFQATGRHVEIQVSWSVSEDYIADWQSSADSWRVGFDVECYCNDLTTWSKIPTTMTSALEWAEHAGPNTGWSNLDSLEVGSAALDGLTETERQTTMSLWSIAAAPLYLGDDLTQIDDFGLSLVTNTDILAIDQDRLGGKLALVAKNGAQYEVVRPLSNGDLAVGLFNLGEAAAPMQTTVRDAADAAGVTLPKRAAYGLFDVWSKERTHTAGRISASSVPAHGAVVFRVSAARTAAAQPPSTTLSVSSPAASVAPGESARVSVALDNDGVTAVRKVRLGLAAPQGWTVDRVGAAKTWDVLPGGSSATASFVATAPTSVDQPITAAELTASGSYLVGGVRHQSTTPLSLSVVSPLDDQYETANTTGTDALVGQAGSTFAISAAGSGVNPATAFGPFSSPASDQYAAAYVAGGLDGDATVRTTVLSQPGSSDRAGIMARNDMDGAPVGVALSISNGRVNLAYNDTAGGGDVYTAQLPTGGGPGGGSTGYPVQLRLERAGAVYTGSYSVDGATWTVVGTITANGQNTPQDVGLFHTSGVAGTPTTATFDDLTIT